MNSWLNMFVLFSLLRGGRHIDPMIICLLCSLPGFAGGGGFGLMQPCAPGAGTTAPPPQPSAPATTTPPAGAVPQSCYCGGSISPLLLCLLFSRRGDFPPFSVGKAE